MFFFRKLGQWIGMLTGIFVEKTDDRFSVERRLAYDRQQRSQQLKQQRKLAVELAEAEDHLAQLQQEKEAALKDKEEAYAIIEDGIANLRAQARQDTRLARRAGMNELRERSLEMREKLSQMIPEDRDNMRQEIEQKLNKREARLEARRELTDRVLSRERDARMKASQNISAKGRANLSELFAEVGYTPTATDASAAGAAAAKERSAEQP